MAGRPAPSARSGDALFAFGSDLTVVSWNKAAEKLTGVSAEDALRRPCWEVLGGHDRRGGLFCHRGCSIARLAREGWVPRRQQLLIATREGKRKVHVSTVVLDDGDAPLFLHVLVPHRTRSSGAPRLLTARQHEILELLATGAPAKTVATRLGIAEVTVRNHIRAILVALDAHSQLEAIANARRMRLID
jgi:PAS domain S-box-containing protein